jgi:hypothetical protein
VNGPPGERSRAPQEPGTVTIDDDIVTLTADELAQHVDRVRSPFRRQWWQDAPNDTTRSEQFRRIIAAAKTECETRRTRVLKHPDLVAALKQPPLSMRPECWNGYIPPAFDPPLTPDGPAPRNTSPFRAALVEICAAAFEREKAAGV